MEDSTTNEENKKEERKKVDYERGNNEFIWNNFNDSYGREEYKIDLPADLNKVESGQLKGLGDTWGVKMNYSLEDLVDIYQSRGITSTIIIYDLGCDARILEDCKHEDICNYVFMH